MAEKDEETITISKSTFYHVIIGILLVALIGSVFTGGFGLKLLNNGTGAIVTPSPSPSLNPSPSPSPNPVAVPQPAPGGGAGINIASLMDDDPKLGSDSAPIVIVEFSDFQCPFCERFYTESFGQIKKDYIDTGKVQLIYRDFPLSFHQYAEKGAEAAECANEQGKFEQMHNMLFEKQSEWTAVGESKLKEYATTLGLDTAKFNNCLDTNKYADEISKDFDAGQLAGVGGTPSFLIGKRDGSAQILVGAQPYSKFKVVIENLLK